MSDEAFDGYYEWPERMADLPALLVGRTVTSVSFIDYGASGEPDPSVICIAFEDGTLLAICATGMHTEGWPIAHVREPDPAPTA